MSDIEVRGETEFGLVKIIVNDAIVGKHTALLNPEGLGVKVDIVLKTIGAITGESVNVSFFLNDVAWKPSEWGALSFVCNEFMEAVE